MIEVGMYPLNRLFCFFIFRFSSMIFILFRVFITIFRRRFAVIDFQSGTDSCHRYFFFHEISQWISVPPAVKASPHFGRHNTFAVVVSLANTGFQSSA